MKNISKNVLFIFLLLLFAGIIFESCTKEELSKEQLTEKHSQLLIDNSEATEDLTALQKTSNGLAEDDDFVFLMKKYEQDMLRLRQLAQTLSKEELEELEAWQANPNLISEEAMQLLFSYMGYNSEEEFINELNENNEVYLNLVKKYPEFELYIKGERTEEFASVLNKGKGAIELNCTLHLTDIALDDPITDLTTIQDICPDWDDLCFKKYTLCAQSAYTQAIIYYDGCETTAFMSWGGLFTAGTAFGSLAPGAGNAVGGLIGWILGGTYASGEISDCKQQTVTQFNEACSKCKLETLECCKF